MRLSGYILNLRQQLLHNIKTRPSSQITWHFLSMYFLDSDKWQGDGSKIICYCNNGTKSPHWTVIGMTIQTHRESGGFWYVFFTMACLRRRRASRVQLGMTKKKKTDLLTEFVSHTCSNAVVTMFIELSASASLHCCFFKYIFTLSELLHLLKDSPTGCFLGCRCRKWGADLHSHSVSWHDRFHSECCEWPPSNPEDGTWDSQTERLLLLLTSSKSRCSGRNYISNHTRNCSGLLEWKIHCFLHMENKFHTYSKLLLCHCNKLTW